MKPTKEQLESAEWWAENAAEDDLYYLKDNDITSDGSYFISHRNVDNCEIIAMRPVKKLKDDPVSNPSHYTKHSSGIECIEVTKHHSFCIGNAIKYIWRHEDKGKKVEDLKKAIWYLETQIGMYESE